MPLFWPSHGSDSCTETGGRGLENLTLHIPPSATVQFHAGHYLSRILSHLRKNLAPYQDGRRRHFVIQADNSRPHMAKTVALVLGSQFPTPSTSSSLFTRSDLLGFQVFGHLKGVLQGNSFEKLDEFLSAIQQILSGVDRETLDRYFKNGWSDCKNVLMEMVNILSNVSTDIFNSFFKP
jgi:hypothetical protein